MGIRVERGQWLVGIAAATTMLLASACPPVSEPPGPVVPSILMSPQLSQGYFSLPWPNDIRRTANGMTDWTSVPGINTDIFTEPLPPIPILPAIVEKGQTTVTQFGRNTAIYFQGTTEIAASTLPTPAQTLQPDASVQLIDLDTGERAPAVVVNQERADRFRPAHLLTILPYPGHPLRSDARYAAVVFDDVTDLEGTPLQAAGTLAELAAPYAASMDMTAAQHAALVTQLAEVNAVVSAHTSHVPDEVVAFTVYRTQKTEREFDAIVASADALPAPTLRLLSTGPCTTRAVDNNASMALVTAEIDLPVWRNGVSPYLFEGGRIVVGPDGKATQFGTRTAPAELLVPCSAMPVSGWPVVTHIDGTGGDQHIDDSTVVGRSGVLYGQIAPLYGDGVGDAGPVLSAVGYTTRRQQVEILFYNLLNPDAIRSNPLQQASDHFLFTRAVEAFSAPGTAFGQPGTVSADPTKVVITGHSQGAQTLPMVAYAEPSLDAVISSAGSGGQYHSVVHSPQRLDAITLVTNHADRLDELNPIIQMVQTVFEASDGANFANAQNYLNYSAYADTCTTVETATHFARAQDLTTLAFSPQISYGEPALDRIVGVAPISANSAGRTRVQVLLPGGHYNFYQNRDRSTAFMNQAFTGAAPVVPVQTYGWSTRNCAGQRYDDPPRLFGI